jgi:hypothetical protein
MRVDPVRRDPKLGRARRAPRAGLVTLLAVVTALGSFVAADALAEPSRTPGERLARLRAASAVRERHVARILEHRDVVGVGTGLDEAGEPAIRVFTARPGVRDLPTSLEGVPLRVEASGRFYALRGPTCEASGNGSCASTERWPLPVPIGVSTGHPAITAGTIGARVTDGTDVFALSNNHVLADVNQATLGDPALQPGSFDGGSVALGDAIGTLADFEPIVFCTGVIIPVCSQTNPFDAAIALTSPGELGVATPGGEFGSLPGYGVPSALLHPAYGDPTVTGDEDLSQLVQLAVQKYGRTTALTTGTIEAVQVTMDVCYDETCSQIARFVDQITIAGGTFSAGGDSGSLVVAHEPLHRPVALLFAGSETSTLASRIDLVLDRFGVTVDDGGIGASLTDAAVGPVAPPPWAVVGEAATVDVTVRNAGTEPLPVFEVVLTDELEASSASLLAPALAPGASTVLAFDWTPGQPGSRTLRAEHGLAGDENAANDAATAQAQVFLEAPGGPQLRLWQGVVRTDAWTTVALDVDYGSQMVVVCTPEYDLSAVGPTVVRVRNASGSSFQVGLGRPWFGALPGDDYGGRVHCMVVREGVYQQATHGVTMEAVRVAGFATTDHAGSWVGQSRTYAQPYLQPVVLGQVVSGGSGGLPGAIGVWSTFWSRGASATAPPSPASLFVGRHTGEDPGGRPAETLTYLVIEAGAGLMEGIGYAAGLSADVVRGMGDAPPYTIPIVPFTTASTAVASQSAMDGGEGGWAILYGADAVGESALRLAIEEDWYFDPERSHPTEQVGYLVFGQFPAPTGCGLGVELALWIPALALCRTRRARPG